jgi:hypothetical protein
VYDSIALKPECDQLLSTFALKLNLRHWKTGYHIAKPFVYGVGRALGLVKPKSFLPL